MAQVLPCKMFKLKTELSGGIIRFKNLTVRYCDVKKVPLVSLRKEKQIIQSFSREGKWFSFFFSTEVPR